MGKVIADVDVSGAGLYTVNGQGIDSMLVVGQKPWHYSYNKDLIRLHEKGTKITAKTVNKAAGLDWEVGLYSKEQLEAKGYRLPKCLPTDRFVMRDDKDLVLGYVKAGYTPYQNEVAPIFLDALVDDDSACFETAGSLYGGRRVWWLMKLPEDILIGGDKQENAETYLLLMNSHDGSVSITVAVTMIRVVCQNTLAYGLRSALRTHRIRHTKNSPAKVTEARRALEIGFKYQEELADLANQMVQTSFSDTDFAEFLDSLEPLPDAKGHMTESGWKQTNLPAITMATKVRDDIINIYENHPTQARIKGTLWGGVQAFQFYADHVVKTKANPTPEEQQRIYENRFRRSTFGTDRGKKAFAKALTLVK